MPKLHHGRQWSVRLKRPRSSRRSPRLLDTYRHASNQNFESSVAAFFAADRSVLPQANLNVALDFRGTSKYNIVGLNTQSEFLKRCCRSRHLLDPRPRLSDARMMLYRPGIDCHVANHFITDGRGMVQIQGLKVTVGTRSGRSQRAGRYRVQRPQRAIAAVPVDAAPRAPDDPPPVGGKPFRLRVPYDKQLHQPQSSRRPIATHRRGRHSRQGTRWALSSKGTSSTSRWIGSNK